MDRKKYWSCAKEEKNNFITVENFVVMKHLSHEMDANTTQQNTNKVFYYIFLKISCILKIAFYNTSN